MTSETDTNTPTAKLRPEAPPYVPLLAKNLIPTTKEPQCSRYSRRSVRRDVPPNSPRPILGTKIPFPRPILGRKEISMDDEDKENEQYFGKEFRSIYRRMQKLKIADEVEKQGKHRLKNSQQQQPQQTTAAWFLFSVLFVFFFVFVCRNCVQCKQMFGPYFQGQACGDACVLSNGQFTPDCNNPRTLGGLFKRLYWLCSFVTWIKFDSWVFLFLESNFRDLMKCYDIKLLSHSQILSLF